LVVTAVADAEWEPTGMGRSIHDLANPRLFDTIVEVFDLRTGAAVGFGRFDDRLYLADGVYPYVYTMEEQASGDFVAVVFEVQFE
jgi:hypothetical protein